MTDDFSDQWVSFSAPELLRALSSRSGRDEEQSRRAICAAAVLLYRGGLIASNDGNLSARVSDGTLLITPSGRPKAGLIPSDLIRIDLEGHPTGDGSDRRLVSSEVALHLEVYRQRPDIRAVIHAHPPHATALTVSAIPFPDDVLAEIPMTIGKVPTVEFAPPGTSQVARAVRPFLAGHDALLLKNHGSLTLGRDMEAAFLILERIESVARVVMLARGAGRVDRLPGSFLDQLRRPESGQLD